ncbi:MAG: YebC/PmpR family DNA-binding transcriptional regulator [Actinomycetota bacterium]
MSGHSKWATTKHKKAVVDARRGKLFAKLLRAIEVAAREGGGSVDGNPTLADAVGRARQASVPGDTIERAVKRGTGELEGVNYETLTYEGYAPGGVAVLVQALSDNRNRTAADVRRCFNKHGGNLSEPGSVAWMFTRRAVVLVPKASVDEDVLLDLALAAGAEDVKAEGDVWEISGAPADLDAQRSAVEAANLEIVSAEVSWQPNSTVLLDRPTAERVLRLIDELEDSEDIQEVSANFDVPDDVMAELAG